MWSVIDKISENVRLYSTPVAALWNVVTFVFRMFVVASVGSSVYGDEQGAFKCDTGQPGCQNVCFNRFSPISHMRFWAFQLLFVATPCLFFHMYAGKETGAVKLLEEAEEKQKKEHAKLAEQEKELDSIAEGIESEFENGDHMSMISTQSMQKHDQLNLEIVNKKKTDGNRTEKNQQEKRQNRKLQEKGEDRFEEGQQSWHDRSHFHPKNQNRLRYSLLHETRNRILVPLPGLHPSTSTINGLGLGRLESS